MRYMISNVNLKKFKYYSKGIYIQQNKNLSFYTYKIVNKSKLKL